MLKFPNCPECGRKTITWRAPSGFTIQDEKPVFGWYGHQCECGWENRETIPRTQSMTDEELYF